MRTYSELIKIRDYYDRFEYLKLGGRVGDSTFGYSRYLNQFLYRSKEWRELRNKIIIRDDGRDMAHPDYGIGGRIIIHHLRPILPKDLDNGPADWVFDPEFLICVSQNTHEAIHYGDANLLPKPIIERAPYDTCPWKKGVRV